MRRQFLRMCDWPMETRCVILLLDRATRVLIQLQRKTIEAEIATLESSREMFSRIQVQ
jgi:hypothetical protein